MHNRGLEDNVLIVGLDDSNHAGERKSEIIVATFSFVHEDSLVKKFGKRASYEEFQRWFSTNGIDYRFSILENKELEHVPTNIPHVAPFLIRNFLENYLFEIENIKIYLDGILRKDQKEHIKRSFQEYPNIIIDNFIKRHSLHECPNVVYMADILSHTLYHSDFQSLSESPKRVIIPY